MSKRKSPGKKNPGRYIKESDLRNMKREIAEGSFEMYAAVVLTVLRDKFGYGHVRLKRALDAMNSLCDELTDGKISHEDLMQVLLDEAGIDLRFRTEGTGRKEK